jgi:hypothetical protein
MIATMRRKHSKGYAIGRQQNSDLFEIWKNFGAFSEDEKFETMIECEKTRYPLRYIAYMYSCEIADAQSTPYETDLAHKQQTGSAFGPD